MRTNVSTHSISIINSRGIGVWTGIIYVCPLHQRTRVLTAYHVAMCVGLYVSNNYTKPGIRDVVGGNCPLTFHPQGQGMHVSPNLGYHSV